MTDTPHLGLPLIDASQAQKHVTHNEALRILDAAIQIAVQDITRSAPPSNPAEGQRHVVAAGAAGAWAGQGNAIASWQDGAWAFLPAKPGWCLWSVADGAMMVFDGAAWGPLGLPSLDSVPHLGINTTADSSNLLSVKSNAVLLAAIEAAAGGSGDVRLQLSKESAGRTASVVFSDAYSGRAEFGLVGADAFRLKVSADGTSFLDAFSIDQASGNMTLPRGLSLSGVIAPAQITANQNDYNPAGLGAAGVLQISADAARSISGLAGGAEGRILVVINVGGQPVTLLDESMASAAANRLMLGGNLTLAAKQAAWLRYDGTAARWLAVAGGFGMRGSNNLSELGSVAMARGNLGLGSAAIRADTDFLRGDTVQSPTTAWQGIALKNIGAAQNVLINGRIVESHVSNTVTFAIKTLAGTDPSATDPVSMIFSNGTQATLTGGLSLTISAGSTLGAASGAAFRVWLAVVNDAGTLRLAARNCALASGVMGFPGDGTLTSTAEGGAGTAKSAAVTYTGAAVAAKPFVIAGFADYDGGLATAGTWDASPTRIQMFGPGIKQPGDLLGTISITGSASNTSSMTPVASNLAGIIVPTSKQNAVRISFQGCGNTNAAERGLAVGLYRGVNTLTTLLDIVSVLYDGSGGVAASITSVPYFDFPHSTGTVGYTVGFWNPNSATQVDFPYTANGQTPRIVLEEVMS